MKHLNWKKGIGFGLLFLLLLGATFLILLKDQNPAQLRAALSQASLPWLLPGIGCMVVFFLCEAKNIQTGLALFSSPASYRQCVKYAITGFFFSSVTPSASGGQPMQLFAMHRDGHAPAPGAMALLAEFLSFQMAAVTLACVGFALHWRTLLGVQEKLWLFFVIGASLNLLIALGLLCAVCSRRLIPSLWKGLMALARRFFPRRADGWNNWGVKQWEELTLCLDACQTHKKQLAKLFATSLVQLVAYHSVPFWVYLSFGLSGHSFPAVVGMQAVLFLSVSSLPLPGAVGLSEGGFLLLYQALFPATVLSGAMILSRAVSFYLFLAASGIILAARFLLRLGRSPQTTRPRPVPPPSLHYAAQKRLGTRANSHSGGY